MPAASQCISCQSPLANDVQFCPRCGTPTPIGTGRAAPLGDAAQRQRIQAALGPDYMVQNLLGSGGFAEVWAAFDQKLHRRVAVKVVHPDLIVTTGLLERFQREARAVAQLRHPGIIPIYTVGERDGIAYYIMPLVEGETLRTRLRRDGALPPEDVRRILREAAAALVVAHRAGIVHRDIKPENLMLDGAERRVLVMDFGIAKSVTSGETGLTGTGSVIGTPAYMSPEQSGAAAIDARSDVYSLGVVGFELLTGKPPYDGASVPALMLQHLQSPVPSIARSKPGVPADLIAAIERCLAKKPAERWPDAEALGRALAVGSSGEHAAVGRGTWSRGKKIGAGVATLVVLAIGTMAWRQFAGRVVIADAVPLRQVTFRGDVSVPVLSPDGRYLAFFAGRRYWVQDLTRDSAWAITDSLPVGGWAPRWTDDGRHLVFQMYRDSAWGTWVAKVGSGQARRVGPGELVDSLAAHKGVWVNFELARDTARRVSAPSWLVVHRLGASTARLPMPGITHANVLGIDDDAKRALLFAWDRLDSTAVLLVDLESGAHTEFRFPLERIRETRPGRPIRWSGSWSGDGRALYFAPNSGTGLWRFDLADGLSGRITDVTLLAPTLDLADKCRPEFHPGRITNRLMVLRTECFSQAVVARIAASSIGPRIRIETTRPGGLQPEYPTLMPIGNRMLFLSHTNDSTNLFISGAASGAASRLTTIAGRRNAVALRLSPDGSTVAVLAGDTNWGIYVVDVRSGTVRELRGGNIKSYYQDCHGLDWDPASRHIYVPDWDERAKTSFLLRLDAVSGAVDTIRPPGREHVACPAASPDGRWVAVWAAGSWGGGRDFKVLLLPLKGDPPRSFPASRNRYLFPLGWTDADEVVVLERPSSTDSSEVWTYSLAGGKRMLGKLPNPCRGAALTPDRRAITCSEYKTIQDVWIADNFDPRFNR